MVKKLILVRFYFDVEQIADEEEGYTLVPDIGPVRIYGAWRYMELVEYNINEVERKK